MVNAVKADQDRTVLKKRQGLLAQSVKHATSPVAYKMSLRFQAQRRDQPWMQPSRLEKMMAHHLMTLIGADRLQDEWKNVSTHFQPKHYLPSLVAVLHSRYAGCFRKSQPLFFWKSLQIVTKKYWCLITRCHGIYFMRYIVGTIASCLINIG